MHTLFSELAFDSEYVVTEHYASLFIVALRELGFVGRTLHICHHKWQSGDQVEEAWIDIDKWICATLEVCT